MIKHDKNLKDELTNTTISPEKQVKNNKNTKYIIKDTNIMKNKVINQKNLPCITTELNILNSEIFNLNDEITILYNQGLNSVDEWYEQVQNRKTLLRKKLILDQERYNNSTIRAQMMEQKVAQLSQEYRSKPYAQENNDPKNNPINLSHMCKIISTISGEDPKNIRKIIVDKMNKGLTQEEAANSVFQNLPMNLNRKIFSLDLEVASPMVHGAVDQGANSSIIEVGYVKLTPDNTLLDVEASGKLFGIEKELQYTIGTGAVDVHQIEPYMVHNLMTFAESYEYASHLLNMIKGSVLIAHNADYEISQLSHALPNFRKSLLNKEFEVLDTKYVTKFFVPGNGPNTNKNFVESTGGSYVGAHRALDDAYMTLNSLLRLKNLEEITL